MTYKPCIDPKISKWLSSEKVLKTLQGMARGVERETLRVTPQGKIAQTHHPKALGSTLCHSSITTDYSEALVELITTPHHKIQNCLLELHNLHSFVVENLDNELLWPFSMPPEITSENDIPIAEYGSSVVGLMKHIYRRGLGVRYGRKMQSIAGVHYNLSFPDSFWSAYKSQFFPEQSLKETKDQAYFKIVRQFLRDGWKLTLMTGASPACHKSFLSPERALEKELKKSNDYIFGPYASSLRMGGLGYHNAARSDLFVCYDSLEQYTQTLSQALLKPNKNYADKGLHDANGHRQQLSTHLLQIENEFYGSIRPKQIARSLERPTLALERSGVAYIEIRNLDIDHESPCGISEITAATVEIFVLGCLLKDEGLLSRQETQNIADRNEQTASNGRAPNGLLQSALAHWQNLEQIASSLATAYDDDLYLRAFAQGLDQLRRPNELKSSRFLSQLEKSNSPMSYTSTGLELSQQHQKFFMNNPLSTQTKVEFTRQAKQSLEDFSSLPNADEAELNATLKEYFNDLPRSLRTDCAALLD